MLMHKYRERHGAVLRCYLHWSGNYCANYLYGFPMPMVFKRKRDVIRAVVTYLTIISRLDELLYH